MASGFIFTRQIWEWYQSHPTLNKNAEHVSKNVEHNLLVNLRFSRCNLLHIGSLIVHSCPSDLTGDKVSQPLQITSLHFDFMMFHTDRPSAEIDDEVWESAACTLNPSAAAQCSLEVLNQEQLQLPFQLPVFQFYDR